MSSYREITTAWPIRDSCHGCVLVSAIDIQMLPRRLSMSEGSEDVTGGKDPTRFPQSPSRSHEARGPRGNPSPITVLIVDDEAPVRETLAEILDVSSYRVITAASVEEAEEARLRLGAGAIHLVIADIHLTRGPQVRAGYALAQRWGGQDPGLPFILMSGDPSNQDLPDVREGTLRFLLKPFGVQTFLDAIREALGG